MLLDFKQGFRHMIVLPQLNKLSHIKWIVVIDHMEGVAMS